MKKQYLKTAAALIVGLCFVASLDAANNKTDAAAANDGGTLRVTRSASVGSGVAVNLAIDGKQVASIANRGSYNHGLAAGKHVLSVVADPNTSGHGANKIEVTAEKGKTYTYVVNSKNGALVLTPKG